MTINKIDHSNDLTSRKATITLSLEEILNITNALCLAVKEIKATKHTANLYEIHRDIYLLFELVKNGCMDGAAIDRLMVYQDKIRSLTEGSN